MAATPLSLKARALQWLTQREHSRAELRRKLMWSAKQRVRDEAIAEAEAQAVATDTDLAAEVDALLEWLTAEHLLSEARFVESRVNARVARYGNLRIRQELSRHATALDAASAAKLKDSELARAQAVWARKFGRVNMGSQSDRARQMRFLAGRGFSVDVIRRVVREAGEDPIDTE